MTYNPTWQQYILDHHLQVESSCSKELYLVSNEFYRYDSVRWPSRSGHTSTNWWLPVIIAQLLIVGAVFVLRRGTVTDFYGISLLIYLSSLFMFPDLSMTQLGINALSTFSVGFFLRSMPEIGMATNVVRYVSAGMACVLGLGGLVFWVCLRV